MTSVTETTWGWFSDPYHQHEYRYFSEGAPTKLVSDAGVESFDPPPEYPMPESPVRAVFHTGAPTGASDMLRADDVEREPSFDQRASCDKAVSAILRFGTGD